MLVSPGEVSWLQTLRKRARGRQHEGDAGFCVNLLHDCGACDGNWALGALIRPLHFRFRAAPSSGPEWLRVKCMNPRVRAVRKKTQPREQLLNRCPLPRKVP